MIVKLLGMTANLSIILAGIPNLIYWIADSVETEAIVLGISKPLPAVSEPTSVIPLALLLGGLPSPDPSVSSDQSVAAKLSAISLLKFQIQCNNPHH